MIGHRDTIACKYLGRTNVWWYNLRDTNPAIEEKYKALPKPSTFDNWTWLTVSRFAVSKDVSAETTFNLTCAAGSGAPATINTDLSKRVSSDKKDGAAQLMGSMGMVGFVAVLSAVFML